MGLQYGLTRGDMVQFINFLNSEALIVFGLSATWAELIGSVLGVAMVICNIRQIHWGWPLAFLSALMYALVFRSVQLHGEAVLQIFFCVSALWGWWQWLRGGKGGVQTLQPQVIPTSVARKCVAFSVLLTPLTALFLARFTSSGVAFWDALPTVLSLVTTYLLAKKYTANWPLWIVVNLISIGLFAFKGLWLTVGLYAVFAVMAGVGWHTWLQTMKNLRAKGAAS